MMHKMVLSFLVMLVAFSAVAETRVPEAVNILVVYYSEKGHTRAMAEAVTEGAAAVEGAVARLQSVSEATIDDVLAADAVIVGSPVYKANVAPPVQEFINQWPIKDGALKDKLGAAFSTGSGISAGEELVQLDIIHAMLVCQMIIIGGPNASQPFGASAITGETPCNPGEEKREAGYVLEHYLEKGKALGARVAQLAVRMKAVQ